MPRSIQPMIRARVASVVAIVLSLSLSVSAQAQEEAECDCSCQAYNRLQAAMQEMQKRGEDGEPAMPTAAVTRLAACAGECAMAWSQCQTPQRGKRGPVASQDRPGTPQREEREPGQDRKPFALGEPRQDLERFHGVYGSPDEPNRNFFVAQAQNRAMEGREIPPGYLMIGAMWGDVAPWYMKSVGEHRFEQQWTNPGTEPLVVEFETDEHGNAVAMRFVSGFLADRGQVQRQGELPEGW
ncbi:MAG: hypothetical protein V2J19_04750 [Wenzhouxiangella sp.]|nr:hypothetical protein [Wenzhouxiangella sp.]